MITAIITVVSPLLTLVAEDLVVVLVQDVVALVPMGAVVAEEAVNMEAGEVIQIGPIG